MFHLGRIYKRMITLYLVGALMKAVRNGDWLLLDEINLAPPETLNSLVLLLDALGHASLCQHGTTSEKPSDSTLSCSSSSYEIDLRALFPECAPHSGTQCRLALHPEFRLFGSMNPGTDFGKHELPPAVRSRFLELYMPDAMAQEDLVELVRFYLHGTYSYIR